MIKVIKRDGREKNFDKRFIEIAVDKAKEEVGINNDTLPIDIAQSIEEDLIEDNVAEINIEEIQDMVIKALKEESPKVAEAYKSYREKRNLERKHPIDKQILELMEGTNEFLAKENANKNSTLISTQRDLMAGTISRSLATRYKIPKYLMDAHNEGLIKFHDLDYFINPMTNCIEENGWITYKDENGVKNIQLKQLKTMFNMKNEDNIQVNKKCFVLGRNGWTRLRGISVRKSDSNETKYEFQTRGINLKTTGLHRIPVIRNGKEILLEAKDIVRGDKLLTTSDVFINPYEYSNSENYINLLDLDDSDLNLRISNISPLRHYIRYKYDLTLQELLGLDKIPKTITTSQLKTILKTVDIPYDIFYKLKLNAKGSKTKLQLLIPVNESLAKLYGYIYADGGVYINEEQSTYQLTFTNTNTELIDDFIDCFEDVFDFRPSKIKPSGTSPCWRSTVGSRLIVKIFKDFCEGKFNGSSDISLPNFIINGDRSIKLAFLSSAIDCDGSLGDKQISYTTCSERFSGQITNIINSLGYEASMTSANTKGSKYYFKHFNGYRNYDTYFIKLSRYEDIYNFTNELQCYKNNIKYQEYKNFKSKRLTENEISNIKLREYECNVYDLQTDSGWFIVNNYAVHNCELVPLGDLFEKGTVINNVHIDTPKSLSTAMTLATQIITQITSFTYGGCTISLSHIAPFVRVSKNKFEKLVREEIAESNIQATEEQINNIVNKRLKKEIKDSVQTFNYQINTMNSSNGQSPFVTIFIYLNENPEYKEELVLLAEEFFKQRLEGLPNENGNKVTQTFPKILFTLDEDNIHEDSEYHWLLKLALKCTAKRMCPDYISAKIMKELYGDVFPCMGCRSFLFPFKPDGEHYKWYGRCNLGVCTINIVDIALTSKGDKEVFWKLFDERMENLVKPACLLRYNKLKGVKAKVAPLLWQYGVFARLDADDDITKALDKMGYSISIGYNGIYEVTKIMTGKSHTTKEGFEFAEQVVKFLNDKADKWKAETGKGFSVYQTPQEESTDWFCNKLKKKFGIVKDVTDKGYITNSYHIDVREPIDIFSKFTIEGKLQKYSKGGNVAYAETGDLTNNIEALYEVIKHMYNTNIHAEINNEGSCKCFKCGYEGKMDYDTNTLEFECPVCKNRDLKSMSIVLRVCGYLSSKGKFIAGRFKDIINRVKHLE